MRPVIGISMGDPAGIGAEIAIKTLARREIYETCIPIIIGDLEPLRDANAGTGAGLRLNVITEPSQALGQFGTADIINLGYLKPGGWEYKKNTAVGGEAAFNYVRHVIALAMDGKLDATVTGPISKESINLAGHHYSGHTEIYADLTHTKDCGMMLSSPTLRVIHVTTHVSMRQACDLIKKDRVLAVIKLADQACRMLGMDAPRVAVAGLNAHCSEGGLFGWEEAQEIIPAIEAARALGIQVEGPIPPDTVFVKAVGGQYDIVVAMYHDQGHIPLKLTGFKLDPKTNRYTSMTGVNSTIGLPIIRTSVDHGTAFGKAGEWRANEESLVDAIAMAVQMARTKAEKQ